MTYDEHEHDRALDANEARMDRAEAIADAERTQWLHANDKWLREDFMETVADLWADYQDAQWAEYLGEKE